jgi:hypothetical protein
MIKDKRLMIIRRILKLGMQNLERDEKKEIWV